MNLNNPANKGTGAVATLSGDRAFTISGVAGFSDGWFALGTVTWLTGANAGRTAEVLSHANIGPDVKITLLEAPVRPITANDAFDVFAGCDKRFETCQAKFANTVNFRGFPHIPGQDTIIRYAAKGDANSGAVL